MNKNSINIRLEKKTEHREIENLVRYTTPSAYFVNESDVELFDKQFPYKEKLVLPTQIF